MPTFHAGVFSGADMPGFMLMEKVRPDLCFPY